MNRTRSTKSVNDLFFPSARNGTAKEFPHHVNEDLDAVFASSSTSFRELIATIVYGKWLNGSYDPRRDLYACNPRPLYEADDGIRPVFLDRRIPCGQSPALNIAKATPQLNEQWAAQRRPQAHAEATLRIVDWAMQQDEGTLLVFAADLGRRFDRFATQVALTQNNLDPSASARRLIQTTRMLIEKHPDGGTIPQTLCGIAVETEYLHQKEYEVFGARDSASATNRTSKKVGDISVEHVENGLVRIYEVTVKKFSRQRVNEAEQSASIYFGGRIPEGVIVRVLCRASDIPEGAESVEGRVYLAEMESGDILFEFVDIYEWLALKISDFTPEQRKYFFTEVQTFLNKGKNGRIPPEIRQAWAAGFAEQSESDDQMGDFAP